MRGVGLLLFSMVTVIGNGLFACTDLAWRLDGAPPETYPEIFYFFYPLPTAILLLIDAILIVSLTRHRAAPDLRSLWQAAYIKLISLGSLSMLCLANTDRMSGFQQAIGQLVMEVYPLVFLPLHVCLTLWGCRQAFNGKPVIHTLP
ncbi:MAG: hypothetical protein QM667_06045 [Asticcacaulis sp.]